MEHPVEAVTTIAGVETKPRGRRAWSLSIALPLAVLAVVLYVLASHRAALDRATSHLPLVTLGSVVLLSVLSLLARAEALVQGLSAMGERPGRQEIHAASALTFVAMTANHYVSSPLRAALLKRTDPERAPTVTEMIVVDTATTLIEALLVVALLIGSTGTLKLPWWAVPAAAAAVVGGFAVALTARRRVGHRPGLRGLEVLAHSRRRLVIAGLLATVIACQVSRTLIVLHVVGLHPSVLQAVATFLAAGVLSSLFAGPAAGAAAAPLLVFGHHSLGGASAAGLVLSMTALLAALVYAAFGAPLFLRQLVRNRS